jgi:hypothetical protein
MNMTSDAVKTPSTEDKEHGHNDDKERRSQDEVKEPPVSGAAPKEERFPRKGEMP